MLVYRFADFELDTALQELRHNGVVKHVEGRIYRTLVYLAENADRRVTNEELHKHVWPGMRFTGSVVASSLFVVRQALEQTARQGWPLSSRNTVGHRIVAPVTCTSSTESRPLDKDAEGRWLRFAELALQGSIRSGEQCAELADTLVFAHYKRFGRPTPDAG